MNLPNHAVSLADCRREVLSAKRHEGGLKMWPCLRLDPDWFAAIVSDTRGLIVRRQASLVARPEHPSSWARPYGVGTQHSLYNHSGQTQYYSGEIEKSADGERRTALHLMADIIPENQTIDFAGDCMAWSAMTASASVGPLARLSSGSTLLRTA